MFSWFDGSWRTREHHLANTAVAITHGSFHVDNLVEIGITRFENAIIDYFIESNATKAANTDAHDDGEVSGQQIALVVSEVRDALGDHGEQSERDSS